MHIRLATLLFLSATPGLVLPVMVAGQTPDYDQLVAQAQADLKAGNAAKALAESQQAITATPTRWEAYVVAGGALQSQEKNDQAADEFSKALERAPAEKQAGIRTLLEGSILAQNPAPAQAAQPQPPPAHTDPAPAITAPVAPAMPNSGEAGSPSLDVTMQFILAHSDISQTIDEHDSLSYQETYGVSSPAACTLSWNSLNILSQFAQNRSSFTVRLADVDSNTIVAVDKAVNLGAAQDHADFAISTVNLQSPHVLSLNYSSKNPSARDARVASGIAAAKTYACSQNEKECTSNQVTNGVSASLWVGDPTMAVRVARALKHAALLCGAKSLTPF